MNTETYLEGRIAKLVFADVLETHYRQWFLWITGRVLLAQAALCLAEACRCWRGDQFSPGFGSASLRSTPIGKMFYWWAAFGPCPMLRFMGWASVLKTMALKSSTDGGAKRR
jgi:hypothetical protein